MSEFRRTGFTRLSVPLGAGGALPEDPLLSAVREAAAPDFEVLGEITRSAQDGSVLYLARASADRSLVALRLTPGPDGEEFQLELARTLDPSLPAPDGTCARCGAQFLAWARFCSKCGAPIFGSAEHHESPQARAELRAAVAEAAGGRYEILGEMQHAAGAGVVYFARNVANGRIEALRVQPEGEQEFSVGKTEVMRRLSVSVQPTRAPTPPGRPAPVPPTPPAAVPPPSPAQSAPLMPGRPAAPAPPPVAPTPRSEFLPPRPAPSETRRSIRIQLPEIRVPHLPPAAWVLIAFVVLILFLILIT